MGADQDIFRSLPRGDSSKFSPIGAPGKLTDNLSYLLENLEFPDEEFVATV
jgi:hypothetical protein